MLENIKGLFHVWQNQGGSSHWLMVYGDAQMFKGHRWVGFRLRPNATKLQNCVYFGKLSQKSGCFFAAIWYK